MKEEADKRRNVYIDSRPHGLRLLGRPGISLFPPYYILVLKGMIFQKERWPLGVAGGMELWRVASVSPI